MTRSKGTEDTPLIERVSDKYLVRWDKKELEGEITFKEIEFPYKPTIDTIKEVILGVENSDIDLKILSGFVWNDMPVWLSSENQFNYKAAYDLAVQTSGSNLPVTFKFGDIKNPMYHKFETIEDLQDFYMKAMIHVNSVLSEGWTSKDSIEWEEYEKILETL